MGTEEKPMWLYIWENVDDVTDGWHYHHDGGVVVVAPDLESARALLPEACGARTHDPDAMYRVDGNPPPNVFLFPNAGCC